MLLGREQIHNPNYSTIEKMYIALFGMPIIGLRIRARNVLALIPKRRLYTNILDAGSGLGVFAFELARRFPEACVTGVDLLPEPIGACRHIASKIKSANVNFLQSTISDMHERDVFDLILCVDILEHIDDDQATLDKLFDMMTKSSVLVLHVPALYRRYPVWRKRLNFDVATHVRIGYQPEKIKRKVEKAGFKICSAGYTYGFWETLANNLSYMITRARMENRIIYSIAFPFLNCMSLLGRGARPNQLGAGVFVVGQK